MKAWLQNADVKLYLERKLSLANITVSSSGVEWQINCPLCTEQGLDPDTGRNLWCNVEKRLGICYRCEAHFDSVSLIQAVEQCSLVDAIRVLRDLSPGLGGVSLETFRERLTRALAGSPDDDLPTGALPPITDPEGFVGAAETSRWPKYLVQRLGSREAVLENGIGWCTSVRFRHRMIVPIFMGGHMVSIVARAMWKPCTGCKGKGCAACGNRKFTKILYPSGPKTGQMLFNYDEAKEHTHVVLVEGVFDAIRVGRKCMALLGDRLSAAQLSLLLASKAEKVTLLLDPDVAGDRGAKKVMARLRPYYRWLRVVHLPGGKDPDTFSRAEVWRRIKATPWLETGNLAARVQNALEQNS